IEIVFPNILRVMSEYLSGFNISPTFIFEAVSLYSPGWPLLECSLKTLMFLPWPLSTLNF
ncbi:hypothetical protein ACQP3F_34640, partial [Escherichia coli]